MCMDYYYMWTHLTDRHPRARILLLLFQDLPVDHSLSFYIQNYLSLNNSLAHLDKLNNQILFLHKFLDTTRKFALSSGF